MVKPDDDTFLFVKGCLSFFGIRRLMSLVVLVLEVIDQPALIYEFFETEFVEILVRDESVVIESVDLVE